MRSIREELLRKVRAQQKEEVLVNHKKVRQAAALRKAKQYEKDPEKIKTGVQKRMFEYRQRNEQKCRAATRCNVFFVLSQRS